MSESGSVAQPSQPSLPTQNEELEAQLVSSRQKTDPAWDYCIYKEVGKKKTYTCMFCNKQINGGGIHRLKEHLAGVVGDVKSCGGVDADTKFRMQENLKETALKKKRAADTFDDEHPFGPNVVELTDDGTSVDVPTSSRPKKKATTAQAYYRDPKARDFVAAVLDSKFWNDVEIIVKIVAPLVCLLRIVDGDDRPSLGYVYDGMFRAKKAIKKIFMNKKSLYKPYTRIIKQRWDKHLRQQLHAAAYVLNLTFYYDSANLSQKPEVMAGFLDVLTAQVDGNKTKFLTEANRYRQKIGEFGKQLALDSIKHMRPGKVFNKNGTYDPIDYERIDDIEFWIMEEDTNSTPILDANEIESMLYNEESIPIIGRLDNDEGELAPTIGLEDGRLNLDSFPQEDVNSYSGDDGFHQFAD
ncbi:hypothetical protein QL285_083366 [Trifolium repens]|nr:hypothetical protein QL285_083366 [Trifolium repens]